VLLIPLPPRIRNDAFRHPRPRAEYHPAGWRDEDNYIIVAPTAFATVGGLVAAWGSSILIAWNDVRAPLA